MLEVNAAERWARVEPGVVLDRLVAVVNGDVILESDVDEERRFEEVQPYRSGPTFTRERIVERLIDRTLILQQSALEPEEAVTDKDLDAQIATLRKDIPACKQYHCETDAGWKKYLGDHGFAQAEFRARWKQRMRRPTIPNHSNIETQPANRADNGVTGALSHSATLR